jgi:H+/Cl- antiporter ClcA
MGSCDVLSNALFFWGIVIGALVGFLGNILSEYFMKWRDDEMQGKQTSADLKNQFLIMLGIFIVGIIVLLIMGYVVFSS